MDAFLHTMAWPFAACLVLTGIHVYLGIHVLERKVIFVDLALAQVAALGTVWGVLMGWSLERDPWAVKGFALAFTFVGAAFFALTRSRRERVPHEAIIGIAYAVALAATILASAHLPHGAEEVGDLLAGSILWVRGETVVTIALLYLVIGAFHFAFRRRFLLISMDPERAVREGIRLGLWDFLFYVSFGCVVTSSVSVGGVLLVFSYLVIPSVVAALFATGVRARLALGWSFATIVSLVGVATSYLGDLPSGPTIVVTFGVFLAAAGAAHALRRGADFFGGLWRVGLSAAALALLLGGSLLLRREEHEDLSHQLASSAKNERLIAVLRAGSDPEVWSVVRDHARALLDDPEPEVRVAMLELVAGRRDRSLLELVHPALWDEDDLVREEAALCLRVLGDPASIESLLRAAEAEEDDFLRVEIGESLMELGGAGGIPVLIGIMDEGRAEQARRDALEHLRVHTELDFPFQAGIPAGENDGDVAPFLDWWEQNRERLSYDPLTKVFRPSVE